MSYLKEVIKESFSLYEGTNNKTLKTVLVSLIGKDPTDEDILDSYCVHHLDCDKNNNKAENICLVNKHQHNLYHSYLRSKEFLNSNETREAAFDRICTDKFKLVHLIYRIEHTPEPEYSMEFYEHFL